MSSESRNDEIEVLRAVAILLVVFFHLNFLFSWRQFSTLQWIEDRYTFWVGVDLFFCISGFVIGRSLLPKLNGLKGKQFWSEVVAFWIRRWYRIIPSAWLWICVVLFLTVSFNQSHIFGHLQSNFAPALSAFLNIANFYYAECLRVGGSNCGGHGPLGVYWSLSLEEQFYVSLPLLIALSGRWLAGLCVLFVMLQFFIDRHSATTLFWYVRTDAIFLGVILAIASQSKLLAIFEPSALRHSLQRWMVIGLLLVSLGAVPAGRMIPFGIGFVAIVSASLVFVASFNRGYLIRDGWLRKAFVWLGTRSYAIYLIHWPVFLLTREFWNRFFFEITPDNEAIAFAFHAFGLVLVLIISDLNYRFVETPIRLRGRIVAAEYMAKISKNI